MVKIRFICVLTMLLGTLEIFSQSLTRSVICITGNTTVESEGLLSYSAGEAITGSLNTPLNCLTQGFQQPSLIFVGNGDTLQGINAVEVYPNPVINELTILFNIRTSKLLHIDLFSNQGNLFRTSNYNVSESGRIVIEMQNFPCGLYLLHVYSVDKLIDRLFKIEKM
jgi:hypothetical protein